MAPHDNSGRTMLPPGLARSLRAFVREVVKGDRGMPDVWPRYESAKRDIAHVCKAIPVAYRRQGYDFACRAYVRGVGL